MNAEELQLGDLVNCNGQELRVKGLSELGKVLCDDEVIYDQLSVEPIPITAERLKGYELWQSDYDERQKLRKTVWVDVQNGEATENAMRMKGPIAGRTETVVINSPDNIRAMLSGKSRIFEGRVGYVHELQQAYRLIGLHELAKELGKPQQ